MEALVYALGAIQNLSWIYESPPHVGPVLQARGALDPLLSEDWSRATVSASAALASSVLALGAYYVFIRPAAHIMRWLAWLAFVVGLPATAGWLAWSVPSGATSR